jgi:hypothetical protein
MMPEDLEVDVVDGGEYADPALFGHLHQSGVGSPRHVRSLGQDGAIMIVGRVWRPPKRREQLMITHPAQLAVAADGQTWTIVQADPDFAVPPDREG